MIGIFFRPDKTQMVKGKIKGGKKLLIKESYEFKSCLEIMEEVKEKGASPRLYALFQSLKAEYKFGREDVYLVMPDEMFEMADTANITNDDELRQFVEDGTGLEFEEMYISTPIKSTPGTNNKKTIYAMQKKLVEAIAEVADKLNIQVVSIEAASMSMIRGVGEWKIEKILIPVTSESANIISYSPLGGIFKMETNLTEKKFVEEASRAEKELSSALKRRDIAAEYTFTSINDKVPVNILSNGLKINLGDREGAELKFQKCVEFEKNVKAGEWLAVVGTLLQVYGEEDEIFADCPPFLKIGSGNILPEEMQVGAKVKHWQQILKNLLYKAAGIMMLIMLAEVGAIVYLNSIQISPELQTEYDEAHKTEAELSREIRIIEQAKREDEKPLEAFTTLMKYRTEEIFLTNINIGGTDSANNWVKFTAVSEDAIAFQELLSQLREEKVFQNCSLAEISSDVSDFKKAHFSLGKGREEK